MVLPMLLAVWEVRSNRLVLDKFYAIDYEINAHFADLIQDKNIHLLIVSALGANANSPIFYNKVFVHDKKR